MVWQQPLLVTLVKLVDILPMPAPPKAGRGRPRVYADRLFLKALVIMMVQRLHKVHECLAVLAEPTQEMAHLRRLLSDDQGRFPSRRTWERRLATLPATLPAQIGCLARIIHESEHAHGSHSIMSYNRALHHVNQRSEST